MEVLGHKIRHAYLDRGYSQKSLAAETRRRDPTGQGVSEKCIYRASSRKLPAHAICEHHLALICDVLGVPPSHFLPEDKLEVLKPGSMEYVAVQEIITAIDSNNIPASCWDYSGSEGTDFVAFIKKNAALITPKAADISAATWISACVYLRHRDILIELADQTYRVVAAQADEMLQIIEKRTRLEVSTASEACVEPKVVRERIAREQDLVISQCRQLLKEFGPHPNLIEVEAQFHLTWAGGKGALRRLLNHMLEVCKQLGDRILWIDNHGNIAPREPRYVKEFALMVDELQGIRDVFGSECPDPHEIKRLIELHTDRSKRLVRENERMMRQHPRDVR